MPVKYSRRQIMSLILIIAFSFILLAQAETSRANINWYNKSSAVEPRQQWNSNFGYCGETSIISAGMRYGQYTSQWTARRLASGEKQTRQSSQLLLGVNSVRTLSRMKLRGYDFKKHARTKHFLAWVKRNFLRDRVVIIGVYNNINSLGEPASLADPMYDHIVPVLGWSSAHRLSTKNNKLKSFKKFYKSDNILISDNGLYSIGRTVPFFYNYRLSDFMKTRVEADRVGGSIYSLRNRPRNYGTVVSGVADPNRNTFPIQLFSNTDGEGYHNEAHMKKPPSPEEIKLTARIDLRKADPNKPVRVYLYNSFKNTPTKRFGSPANYDKAIKVWKIPPADLKGKKVWKITIQAKSNQTRVFRAVQS